MSPQHNQRNKCIKKRGFLLFAESRVFVCQSFAPRVCQLRQRPNRVCRAGGGEDERRNAHYRLLVPRVECSRQLAVAQDTRDVRPVGNPHNVHRHRLTHGCIR